MSEEQVVGSENLLECLVSVVEEVNQLTEYVQEMATDFPNRDFSKILEPLTIVRETLNQGVSEEISLLGFEPCGQCEHCVAAGEESSFEDALVDAVQEVVNRFAGAKTVLKLHVEIGSEELH